MSETLMTWAEGLSNPWIEEWKTQGRPVLGYVCSYIPRELIHAAGILPYRIGARGATTTSQADAWMASITCSFTRSCLELALGGKYAFLDGLVSMNTCECMRRMCDNWRHGARIPYFYSLSVPYKADGGAVRWYREELELFRKSLKDSFGSAARDEDLLGSITLFNETRRLLKAFHATRAAREPPMTGAEAQRVTLMAYAMPVEEYNRALADLVQGLPARMGISDSRIRLMLVGNTLDDLRFTEILEGMGCLVVADASCYGAFEFWETMPPAEDPLEGIARYYLSRVACPRMVASTAVRRELIQDMVETFHIDGIVFERMMYCDLWGGETMSLEADLKELDIPFLLLDREYTPGGLGQMRTRLQAFVEMIRRV